MRSVPPLAATGPDGRASFKVADDGDWYLLRVSHPAYATTWAYPINTFDPATLSRSVVLREGLAARLQVTDEVGIAIPDAKIVVQNLGPFPHYAELERSGVTDAPGLVLFDHLAYGEKFIDVQTPGRAPKRVKTVVGTSDEFDLVIALESGHRFEGVVTDRSDGRPIAGVLVLAHGPDAMGLVETRTDAAGRYLLEGVSDPVFSLAFHAEDTHDTLMLGKIRVNRSPYAVAMVPKARIEGRVVAATTSALISEFGLTASRYTNVLGRPARSLRDADGRFSIGVLPGINFITISAEGFAPAVVGTFDVQSGSRIQDVEIRLDEGCHLNGLARSSHGIPIERATVSLRMAAGDPTQGNPFERLMAGLNRPAPSFRTRTDSLGHWSIPRVPPGRWEVRVEEAGFASADSPSSHLSPVDRTSPVPEVVLSHEAVVFGRVRTSDGSPDGKASIVAQLLSSSIWKTHAGDTRADGRYEIRALPPGRYLLSPSKLEGLFLINPPHVRIPEKRLDLCEGERVEVNF